MVERILTFFVDLAVFFSLGLGYARGIFNGIWLRMKDCYLAAFASFALPGTKLSPNAGAIPESYFGMHINHPFGFPPSGAEPDEVWPSVHFAARRLWDCGVSWAELEPNKGDWRFSRLDMILADNAAHGVESILTLGITPDWAAAKLQEPRINGGGSSSVPKDIEDWKNYVRTAVSHCKGRVKQYEIWNEPDLNNFHGGVAGLVELTKAAFYIVKEIDPGALVISPSFSEDLGVVWLAKFLALGGGQFVDIVGHHFYLEPRGPEGIIPLAQAIRRLMNNHGLAAKPVWNTESGWRSEYDEMSRQNPDIFTPTPKLSGYLARMYVLNWALGLHRFYWYTWNGGSYAGMIDEQGTPNHVAKAYEEVRGWLLGVTMLSCSSDEGNVWTCELKRDDGSVTTIVWCSQRPLSPKDYDSPMTVKAPTDYVRDLTGAKQHVGKSNPVAIGIRPLLFTPN